MKYLFFCCTIYLCSCGECDNSKFYQIRSKDPDATNPAMCHYRVEGLGGCTTWQKTEQLFFADSCKKFSLSQILSRAQVQSYSATGSPK